MINTYVFIMILLLSGVSFGQELDSEAASLCSRTPAMAKKAVFSKPAGAFRADNIVVDKKRRILHLLDEGQIFRSYHVALGRQPIGKKRQVGDNKTPEGQYRIGLKNSASKYHLALEITYPNQDDVNWAREHNVEPGGSIMIHGLPNEWWKKMFINHPKVNWTRGCVAVSDREVEEIWSYVRTGTTIELCP